MSALIPNENTGGSGHVASTEVEAPEEEKTPLVPFIDREPVVVLAAVRALIYFATAWGLEMSAEQITALVVAVEAILALITRQHTTPFVANGKTPNVK